jgi:hypothetical protein
MHMCLSVLALSHKAKREDSKLTKSEEASRAGEEAEPEDITGASKDITGASDVGAQSGAWKTRALHV